MDGENVPNQQVIIQGGSVLEIRIKVRRISKVFINIKNQGGPFEYRNLSKR